MNAAAPDPFASLTPEDEARLEREAIQEEARQAEQGRFRPYTETPKPPPVIHWAAEALEPQPEKSWIVHDLIGSGDILTIIGDAGSKKTYVSIDLAVAVAQGADWLGRRVTRSRVLLVDEESGERRLKKRLGDAMRAHEARADLPVAFTSLAGITLATDAGAERLQQIIQETDAQLIIMDALQDFTLGLDENSGKELAPVIHRLRLIAEKLNCAIWLIHHLNKQGGYRGHSSIKGLVDVMLRCESQTDSSLIQFAAEKSRDSLIAPFAATAHFEIGKFWLSDANATSSPAEKGYSRAERYVRGYMLQQPDKRAAMRDITGHADVCSPESARRATYDLCAKGYMRRVNEGGRGTSATFEWVGL